MKKMLLSALAIAFVATLCVNVDAEEPKKKEKKEVDRSALFTKLDTDKDGKLSKEEFVARAKTDEAKERAGKQFARIDKDKDGSLSKEEFVNVTPPKKKPE